jgi:hypothetical protein
MPLTFLHFDTTYRTNPKDDPFNCSLQLSNPLRNIKKIYLKSCEIPLGFFNVRTVNEFSFTVDIRDKNQNVNPGYFSLFSEPNPVVAKSTPTAKNSYFNPEGTPTRTAVSQNPIFFNNIDYFYFPVTYSVIVPSGNYTIDSLLTYINTELTELQKKVINLYHIRYEGDPFFTLSKIVLNDTGAFPVGFVQLTCALSNIRTTITSSNNLTNTMLKFDTNQINSRDNYNIVAPNLWGIYNDLNLHLYFPNIPHNNTHFSGQLMSFKIPMSAGYQAISFSTNSESFSQYIDVLDSHFILNNLKLMVFDTHGELLVNQYNWNFTLGFELA